jgi:hypothetical protein
MKENRRNAWKVRLGYEEYRKDKRLLIPRDEFEEELPRPRRSAVRG